MGTTSTDSSMVKSGEAGLNTASVKPDFRKSSIDSIEALGMQVKHVPKKGTGTHSGHSFFPRSAPIAVTSYVHFTKGLGRREYFEVKQKWVGIVTKVKSESFSARLVDETSNQSDIVADLLMEDVDSEDKSLLQVGAIFYLSIGYLNRTSGRIRASLMRFKREPEWSHDELVKAQQKAELLSKEIGWTDK
jgi:hypothetical protein